MGSTIGDDAPLVQLQFSINGIKPFRAGIKRILETSEVAPYARKVVTEVSAIIFHLNRAGCSGWRVGVDDFTRRSGEHTLLSLVCHTTAHSVAFLDVSSRYGRSPLELLAESGDPAPQGMLGTDSANSPLVLFTPTARVVRVVVSRLRGRAVRRTSYDSMSLGRFRFVHGCSSGL